MKKILCVVTAIALLMSGITAFADIEAFKKADCVYDTYTEKNVTTSDNEKSGVLLSGNVYDRTAYFAFDISGVKSDEYKGCILNLTLRNSTENNCIRLYSYDKDTKKTGALITQLYLSDIGKLHSRVLVTSHIKELSDSGAAMAYIAIKATADITTFFSSESENTEERPYLAFTKDTAYIEGQKDFEWPQVTAKQFEEALAETVAGGHPYLFGRKADFDRTREYSFGKDEILTNQYIKIKEEATKLLTKPVEAIKDPTQGRANSYIGRGFEAAWNTVPKCAFVYLMEGDERYANRAWQEAEYFAGLDSWGNFQYLDNNQAAMIVAICYDWLYDYLSEQQRETLVTALKTKHLDTLLDLLKNPSAAKYQYAFYRQVFSTFNHGTMNNCTTFMQALAVAETDKAYSAEIMSLANKNINKVVDNLCPDSGWPEGVGYWGFVGPLVARWLSSMKSAFGTCFGYENIPVLMNNSYFPLYSASSAGMFLFNDAYPSERSGAYDMFVLAAIGGDKALEKYTLQNNNLAHPIFCLTYNPQEDYTGGSSLELSKDMLFRNVDLATMRSTWQGTQETFTGMVVQPASKDHSHMNSGTIVLDALGEKWITNPGADNYSLPGYFVYTDEARWQYYVTRAEANSCLVINPSQKGGQNMYAEDTIDKFESGENSSYAVADLTDTYKGDVSSYKRGVALTNNRKSVVLQDEAVMLKNSEVYSFLNFSNSDIELLQDGKTAIISKGNKKLLMNVMCDAPFEMKVMDAVPLLTSPNPEGQKNNDDIKKIAIYFKSIDKLNLSVTLTPYLLDAERNVMQKPQLIPISQWSVDEGEAKKAPVLSEIKVDSVPRADYNDVNRCYEIISESMPQSVEALADSEKYDVTVTRNDEKRCFEILVSDKADKNNINTYIVYVTEPEPEIVVQTRDVSGLNDIAVSKVYATENDGNVEQNTIDGNIGTRWSAEGDGQTITFALRQKATLNCIAIAFYNGHTRSAMFDLQVSPDGSNWKTVESDNKSCGITEDFEFFDLHDNDALFVRILCHGNNANEWNSISEVKIYGK